MDAILQKVFITGDMLLNPEQECSVPGIEPRDRVVLLHLGRERVHVVIVGTTDQSLQILQNKE
jgi:hypothetical protein